MSRSDYELLRGILWEQACGAWRLGRINMALGLKDAYFRLTHYAVIR